MPEIIEETPPANPAASSSGRDLATFARELDALCARHAVHLTAEPVLVPNGFGGYSLAARISVALSGRPPGPAV